MDCVYVIYYKQVLSNANTSAIVLEKLIISGSKKQRRKGSGDEMRELDEHTVVLSTPATP